jgi:hypothetical protein
MAYLDVSPMLTSLRTAPEEFEINEGWLRHIPSRHDFRFDPQGNVRIRAQCNCSELAVRVEQSGELSTAYNRWESQYWRPLLINREFASHFQRSPLRQLLVDITGWLHRRLLEQRHGHANASQVTAFHPAE